MSLVRNQVAMTRVDRNAGFWLTALGVLTVGTGLYFMLLRPPMLPEDIRFTGIEAPSPGLLTWLSIVFPTWGGFMTGFGILLTGIGAFLFTGRRAWLRNATAVGVLVAFGRFLLSNLRLRSDFLWYISLLFLVAVVTVVLLVVRRAETERLVKEEA